MIFILQLTFQDSTFEYSLPQELLRKKYKIEVIKLDGYLKIKSKINNGSHETLQNCNE
jgi:hypothetical protein